MSTFPEPIPSPDPLDPMEGTCSHGRYADQGCGECEEKQQRDRGYKDVGREYDKYEHEEFTEGDR